MQNSRRLRWRSSVCVGTRLLRTWVLPDGGIYARAFERRRAGKEQVSSLTLLNTGDVAALHSLFARHDIEIAFPIRGHGYPLRLCPAG
jgi:hypothetical protein